MFRNALRFFGAGTLGALISCLVLWQFGQQGINQSLGVALAPSLTPYWLYPRLVWGGLWGLLFLMPLAKGSPYGRGILLSFIPALVQLFFVFPYQEHQGVAGLELGVLTPVLVFFFSAIWGLATAIAIKLS